MIWVHDLRHPEIVDRIVATARRRGTPSLREVQIRVEQTRAPEYVDLRNLVSARRALARFGLPMTVTANSEDARRLLGLAGL